jgi:hypothetical protein
MFLRFYIVFRRGGARRGGARRGLAVAFKAIVILNRVIKTENRFGNTDQAFLSTV